MRDEVLEVTRPGWVRVSDGKAAEVKRVEELLKKYGGNPNFAHDMVEHSTKGNLLAYAIQEHIVAASLREAHYDAVIGYGKAKGAPRLSEVFDLREEQFPWRDKWTEQYEEFYEDRPEGVGILDPMQIGKFNELERAASLPDSIAPQGYSMASKEAAAAYPIGKVTQGRGAEKGVEFVEKTHPPEELATKDIPADKVVERSVIMKYLPGYNFADDVRQGALLYFGPTAKSPEHYQAGVVLGSHLGTLHRAVESTYRRLDNDSVKFDKLGIFNKEIPLEENLGIKFMSDMSTGRKVAAEFQPIVDRIRGAFYDRLKRLEEVGAPLEKIRDNYFPGIWKKESIRAFNRAMEVAISEGRGGEAREGGVGGQIMDLNDWTAADKKYVADLTKEFLKTGLAAGRWRPGALMPSEAELVAHFGISRMTPASGASANSRALS
jgi:hypothetical protein